MHRYLFPKLMLTSLCLNLAGQLRRCFTVMLSFSLLPEENSALLSEEKGWQAAAQSLEPGGMIDLGLPKPMAEWLMAGYAYVPEGEDARALLPVDVSVDENARQFLVNGDRLDNGLGSIQVRPFQRMALDWAHTFGGQGYAANPKGKGFALHAGMRHLPNITSPGLNDTLFEPVCPSALLFTQRNFVGLGNFDETWLKTRWPGPPDDFDWTFYNLAQSQQRQASAFTGLERVRITNMHPQYPVLQASLPGLRLRLFVNYAKNDEDAWHETPVQADTVWLLPNAGLGMQLWHATTPCQDERSSDIKEIAVCYEPVQAEPRSAISLIQEAKRYALPAEEPVPKPQAVVEKKQEQKRSVPPLFSSTLGATVPPISTLIPPLTRIPTLPSPDPSAALATFVEDAKGDVASLLSELNPLLQEQGLPPIRHADVIKQLEKTQANMQKILAQPQDPDTIMRQAGLDETQIKNIHALALLEPPRPELFASQDEYQQALTLFGARFQELTGASDTLRDTLLQKLTLFDQAQTLPQNELMQQLIGKKNVPDADLETALRQAGLEVNMPHLQGALDTLEQAQGDDQHLLAALGRLGDALGVDPTSLCTQFTKTLNTARYTLYAMPQLTQTLQEIATHWPEYTRQMSRFVQNLAHTRKETLFDLESLAKDAGIDNKELLGAIKAVDPLPMHIAPPPKETAQSNSVQAPPVSAVQAEALAQEVSAQETTEAPPEANILDFSGQDLTNANFAGLDLTGAQFSQAVLVNANFSRAIVRGASFSQAVLQGAVFTEATLTDADFTQANLSQASLIKAIATQTTFDGALFQETKLVGCDASAASFRNIKARGQDFSQMRLQEANFENALLEQARFVESDLSTVTFQSCVLTSADFTRALLTGARLYDCHLQESLFLEAHLEDSNWLRCLGKNVHFAQAHLGLATFEECSLPHANFDCIHARGCRLLACDLYGSSLRYADLMQGALRDSKLGNANVTGASLYGADLYLMAINAASTFTDADVHGTCLRLGE